MKTTPVVAEIVVVGLEAAAWVATFVAAAFGTGWMDVDRLQHFDATVAVLVLGASYGLGVIVDRVADSLFRRPARWWFGRSLNRFFGEESDGWDLNIGRMRIAVMRDGTPASDFVDYQRSRVRVARGTVVNLAFGMIAASTYFGVREEWQRLLLADAILFGLIVLALPASERIHSAWLKRLCDAYEALPGAREIVAAVPVTGAGDQRRFLLVKTSDGERWTFPKGHVEAHEKKRAAVRRELSEEGGVVGRVDDESFATYRYPAAGKGDKQRSKVKAYLVRVPAEVEPVPAEEKREPTWATHEEAAELLGVGRDREPDVVAGQRKVLADAVELLEAEEKR